MFKRLIINDMKSSPYMTVTITTFILLAALLTAVAAAMGVSLSGSVNHLLETAKAPHFLQMHSRDLDRGQLEAFAQGDDRVAAYAVQDFLNIEGADFVIDGQSLADSVQDNGLVVQNKSFDLLLDLKGEVIEPAPGEIYAPLVYYQNGRAQVGDQVTVAGHPFVLKGFLRDAQMSSTLSLSKRFLVHEDDFEAVRDQGQIEHLILFQLHDDQDLPAFETAYLESGIGNNGPTITYPLFKLVNSLSNGILIGVLLFLSFLVILMAFLCIRFTLLAKIEEDYRQIGVLKAIGMRLGDIKKIYLAKYGAIALFGVVVGYLLSIPLRRPLLANIYLYMGKMDRGPLMDVLALLGVALIFLLVMAFVYRVLSAFNRLSAADAVRFGAPQAPAKGHRAFQLSRQTWGSRAFWLAIKDLASRRRLYGTLVVLLTLVTVMMLFPLIFHHSLSAPAFITTMGVGDSDLLIDIQQTDDPARQAQDLYTAMEGDDRIDKASLTRSLNLEGQAADGSWQRIKVELGDHAAYPLEYDRGQGPAHTGEIALSNLMADDLGLDVGDRLIVRTGEGEEDLMVSGIYSDITNGGKTAKALFANDTDPLLWATIKADVKAGEDLSAVIEDYSARFPYAKVSSVAHYRDSILGDSLGALGRAGRVAMGVAFLMSLLMTYLFLRMLVVKDRHNLSLQKVLGMTRGELQGQYLYRSLAVFLVSLVLGYLLVALLGPPLAGGLLGGLGASNLHWQVFSGPTLVVVPFVLALGVGLGTYLAIREIADLKAGDYMKE